MNGESQTIQLLARSLPDGGRLTANAIIDQTGQAALVLGLKDRNQNGSMRRRAKNGKASHRRGAVA